MNTNITVIGITHCIITYVILSIHSVNKFELDRLDQDNHANRANRYLV